MVPFVSIEICKKGCKLVTSVYRKPTSTGLLLHHQSHVDNRYKRSLVKTMLNHGKINMGTIHNRMQTIANILRPNPL